MNVKMTFTIPAEIAHRFKNAVPHGKRSAFVAVALGERLLAIEEEQPNRT